MKITIELNSFDELDDLNKVVTKLSGLTVSFRGSTNSENVSGPPIEELSLSKRLIHILKAENINTASDLASKTTRQLLLMDGIGRKSIDEIRDALQEKSLSLID